MHCTHIMKTTSLLEPRLKIKDLGSSRFKRNVGKTENENIEFKKHLSSKDETESNPAPEKEKKIYRSLTLCGTLFQVAEFLTSRTSHCNSLHQKPLWLNSLKAKN